MAVLTYFFLFFFLTSNFRTIFSISSHPKLLVISYDAFRKRNDRMIQTAILLRAYRYTSEYDYFNRNLTPFMNQLRSVGTHAEYMKNIFVTKTFPNHHTMATGLYAETHGVMGNVAYDPETGNVTKYSYKLYHYNEEILPIWTVNEKAGNGRHSGTMMWPGSAYEYQGVKPTFAEAFNVSISWEERIDKLVSWFTHPKTPINLGMLYIEEPDMHGHALGINSPGFNDILKKMDDITKYIHDKLDQDGLKDVNVVHLSDHGMESVTMDKIINLTKYVNDSDYQIVGTSPSLQIFPKPGEQDLVYQNLVTAAKETHHFTVYKKEEIPKKYHFGNNPRVAPIFIVADVGYAFHDIYENIKYYEKIFNFTANNKSEFGVHGYDNEATQMHPMFFANGPAFKQQYELNPFNNTDLFPLFCEILSLKCPSVNGTLQYVESCLIKQPNSASAFVMTFIGIGIVLVVIGTASMLTIFVIKRRRRISKANYRRLPDDSDIEYLWAANQDFENV